MTDQLYDAVARIARHEAGGRSWAEIGRVTDVHADVLAATDHAVTVELRDRGVVVPRLPIAVGALGLAVTPAVGDVVVVVFAGGDPHAGVVVGRLYHRDLAPPKHDAGQLVLRLPPGASDPDVDVLVDPATPVLTLHVGETTVEIAGEKATLTIGKAELVVDGADPGAVTVSAGDASVSLGGGGDVTIEAATTLELKAKGISIEGSNRVRVSGGVVEVN